MFIYVKWLPYIYVCVCIHNACVLLNGSGIVFWMFGEERMQNVRDMYLGKV